MQKITEDRKEILKNILDLHVNEITEVCKDFENFAKRGEGIFFKFYNVVVQILYYEDSEFYKQNNIN